MMKILKKKSHTFVFFLLIGLCLAWIIYGLFGPGIIESAYEGKSISLFNKIIDGKNVHPVEYYYTLAERLLKKTSVYVVVLSIVILLPINIRLTIVSIVVTFLIIEVGLQIFHAKYLRYPHGWEKALYQYDSVLGWKMRPNFKEHLVSWQHHMRSFVEINSKGLRDEEYTYKKDPEKKRVLLLGDSVLAGVKVKKDYLVDTQLENWLNQHGQYEVINAGAEGYGTDQAYIYFEREGYKYDPDIVVYIFVPNDLYNNVIMHYPYREYGKSYFAFQENGSLVLTGVPIPRSFTPHGAWLMSDKSVEKFYNENFERTRFKKDGLQLKRRGMTLLYDIQRDLAKSHVLKLIAERVIALIRQNEDLEDLFIGKRWLDPIPGRAPIWDVVTERPPHVARYEWKVLEILLSKMARLSDSLDAKFLVYEFGALRDEEGPTQLKDVCEKLGIAYVDSFKEFNDVSQGRAAELFIPNDGHWNSRGHQLAAKILYTYLKNKNWIK